MEGGGQALRLVKVPAAHVDALRLPRGVAFRCAGNGRKRRAGMAGTLAGKLIDDEGAQLAGSTGDGEMHCFHVLFLVARAGAPGMGRPRAKMK